MSYYQHIDDFEGVVPKDNAMPADVKRLISHCNYNYLNRLYFFSPSRRTFYRYYTDGHAYIVYNRPNHKSYVYQFIPDDDNGTHRNQHYRDCITVSDRFIQRIENMNKLILPKLH